MKEDEADDDEERYSVWTYLSDVANNDEAIQKRIEDAKSRLADDELSKEQITQEALRVVKPYKMDFMYKTYASLLKMWHFTERDVYHKKIMQTKKRLLEEEDIEPVEAIELAVKKRKFIIQRATGTLDDDSLEETLPPPSFEQNEEQNEEQIESPGTRSITMGETNIT